MGGKWRLGSGKWTGLPKGATAKRSSRVSRPAASPRTVSVISTESPSCPLASSCASDGSRSTWWVRFRVRVRVRVGVRIRARSSPSA